MTTTRNPANLLLLLLFFFFFAAGGLPGGAAAPRGPLVGGYSKIKDVKDPHIKEIGKYAVSENNKQTGGSLLFVRVVSGRQQVVAGMNYDLVIEATDGAAKGRYEAVVYERAWENYRSLTSFKRKT